MDIADIINDSLGWIMTLWEGYGWWIVAIGVIGGFFIARRLV